MSADKDNLLDPTNPKSPYNRYNWDSPYSILNPMSPHYLKSEGNADPFWSGVFLLLFITIAIVARVYFYLHPM